MKHHEDSIELMKKHYQENPEIIALFLVGSVATGTERANSDLDGVAVVSHECYLEKKKIGMTMETCWGKCAYEGGYFDIHYLSKQELIKISESGTEPMRNLFMCARTLFCNDPEIPEIVNAIPAYQKAQKAEKQLRFYCTFKQAYSYFWKICKPEGFARTHTANCIIYNLYRLILLENEILFPSVRKLEITVKNAANKPEMVIDKCHKFLQTLNDDDALELINSYENWTTYDFPKEFQFIANNFNDPYEWV